ncbi:MAG: biotin transporter BioY [Clostridiales bacterium]|nr:biotin transporter BioY [Clostridiales bacterium]
MKKPKTFELMLCALFAALSAILSQIVIPIGPVPVSFTHVSIFVAAGLLGMKYGTLSQVVYVLLGAMGVPVFAGFTGGMGIVVGPTGGFIIGYIVCAFIVGLIAGRFGTSVKALIPAMCAGWVATYALGLAWFMHYTNLSLVAALPFAMLPFIPGDIVKTILSVILINRLHPVVKNMMINKT